MWLLGPVQLLPTIVNTLLCLLMFAQNAKSSVGEPLTRKCPSKTVAKAEESCQESANFRQGPTTTALWGAEAGREVEPNLLSLDEGLQIRPFNWEGAPLPLLSL